MGMFDDLGNRMKTYERVPKNCLMRRTPVIVRVDGRSFHSFTRGMAKPFDDILIDTMQCTMKALCENVQGCVLGYCESDEISLLLIDYKTLETSAWFDNEVQKICSIAAATATLHFNKAYLENISEIRLPATLEYMSEEKQSAFLHYYHLYHDKVFKAMFDARCFNLPKEEVTNYFYWRQLDAKRNSVQSVGQANFSQKELQGKSCIDIKQMLLEKNIDWNDFSYTQKWGSCCLKGINGWYIDNKIPLFKNEGRSYIENIMNEFE